MSTSSLSSETGVAVGDGKRVARPVHLDQSVLIIGSDDGGAEWQPEPALQAAFTNWLADAPDADVQVLASELPSALEALEDEGFSAQAEEFIAGFFAASVDVDDEEDVAAAG